MFLIFFLLISPPGIAALYYVMKKWLEDEEISIWSAYWTGWKINWKKSYFIINFYILIGIVLYIDLVFIINTNKYMAIFIGIILFPAVVLYLLIGIIYLPLYIRYQWDFTTLIKNAFFMSIRKLFSSLIILILIAAILVGMLQTVPLIAFLFFVSLSVWIFTWQTNRIKHGTELVVSR